MPTISIFSSSFCGAEQVVGTARPRNRVPSASATKTWSPRRPFAPGSRAPKIARVFTGKPSVFNAFTHERERSLAYLKLCLAEMLVRTSLIVSGFAVPPDP